MDSQDIKFRGRYGFRRLQDPVFEEADFNSIDLWLLTHGHEDHLDEAGVQKIRRGQAVLSHPSAAFHLDTVDKEQIRFLRTGEVASYSQDDLQVTVEAMRAVHGKTFLMRKLMGQVHGYWLTITKPGATLSVYVTSDTVNDPLVLASLKGRRADILIPNMGGVLKGSIFKEITLTAEMLMDFVKILRPRYVFPVHFGTFSHYKEPIDELYKFAIAGLHILDPGGCFEVDPKV